MFIVIYIFIKFLSHKVEMRIVHFVKTRQTIFYSNSMTQEQYNLYSDSNLSFSIHIKS